MFWVLHEEYNDKACNFGRAIDYIGGELALNIEIIEFDQIIDPLN